MPSSGIAALDPVKGLSAAEVKETEITLAWESVEGAEFYEASIKESEDKEDGWDTIRVRYPEVTFSGLTKNTKYDFKVCACAGERYSREAFLLNCSRGGAETDSKDGNASSSAKHGRLEDLPVTIVTTRSKILLRPEPNENGKNGPDNVGPDEILSIFGVYKDPRSGAWYVRISQKALQLTNKNESAGIKFVQGYVPIKYTDLKDSVKQHLEKRPGGNELVRRIQRTKNSIKELMIPGMFFEDMGITYIGPVDGHDIPALIEALRIARRKKGPVLVHVVTQKGRGYLPAVRHPERFHGTSPFEVETGLPRDNGVTTYTDVFSTVMVKMGERNPKVCAVTAAMEEGTGLKRFAIHFPERFFDTGIAEEHAVTFAAGLALGGMIPVAAVYSAFLQRSFDQIMDDVCLQNLHVVFCVDRAGFVGADGATHNGCFDLSYLSMMPNMTVMAPKNKWELSDMVKFAVDADGPVAIRYPKAKAWDGLEDYREEIRPGRAEVIEEGADVALLAVGAMVETACGAAEILKKHGISPTIVNVRFVKPFDRGLFRKLAEHHHTFVTIEENVRSGGFGEQVADFVSEEELPVRVQIMAVPDRFIHHASIEAQRRAAGIDRETVARRILEKTE